MEPQTISASHVEDCRCKDLGARLIQLSCKCWCRCERQLPVTESGCFWSVIRQIQAVAFAFNTLALWYAPTSSLPLRELHWWREWGFSQLQFVQMWTETSELMPPSQMCAYDSSFMTGINPRRFPLSDVCVDKPHSRTYTCVAAGSIHRI